MDNFSDVPPLTRPEDSPPVRTDEELLVRWRQLMGPGGFGGRSLWVLWFDADGFQTPVVAPIDDIPESPDPELVTNLMVVVDEVSRGEGRGGCVAMTLSRPGTSQLRPTDRAWGRALRERARAAGVALWPVHLATTDSVRPLTLDDLGWDERRSA